MLADKRDQHRTASQQPSGASAAAAHVGRRHAGDRENLGQQAGETGADLYAGAQMTVGWSLQSGTAVGHQRNGGHVGRGAGVAEGGERQPRRRRSERVEAQLLRDSVTKIQPGPVR